MGKSKNKTKKTLKQNTHKATKAPATPAAKKRREKALLKDIKKDPKKYLALVNAAHSVKFKEKNPTRKEITGDNIQTTTLRVKLNGVFIGKFNNVTRDMAANSDQMRLSTLAYMDANYGIGTKADPHAEDYLIYALEHNLKPKLTALDNTQFNLLSIAIDKSPCEVCARNLLALCNKYGLKLRVKVGYYYDMADHGTAGVDTGVKILAAANVPVRPWTLHDIGLKLGAGTVNANRQQLMANSIGTLPLSAGIGGADQNTHIGWKTVGYSRSQKGTAGTGDQWT